MLNAEERFLKHLAQLHRDFPKLRIVLEHATTKAAVEMVGRTQYYMAYAWLSQLVSLGQVLGTNSRL